MRDLACLDVPKSGEVAETLETLGKVDKVMDVDKGRETVGAEDVSHLSTCNRHFEKTDVKLKIMMSRSSLEESHETKEDLIIC